MFERAWQCAPCSPPICPGTVTSTESPRRAPPRHSRLLSPRVTEQKSGCAPTVSSLHSLLTRSPNQLLLLQRGGTTTPRAFPLLCMLRLFADIRRGGRAVLGVLLHLFLSVRRKLRRERRVKQSSPCGSADVATSEASELVRGDYSGI